MNVGTLWSSSQLLGTKERKNQLTFEINGKIFLFACKHFDIAKTKKQMNLLISLSSRPVCYRYLG